METPVGRFLLVVLACRLGADGARLYCDHGHQRERHRRVCGYPQKYYSPRSKIHDAVKPGEAPPRPEKRGFRHAGVRMNMVVIAVQAHQCLELIREKVEADSSITSRAGSPFAIRRIAVSQDAVHLLVQSSNLRSSIM